MANPFHLFRFTTRDYDQPIEKRYMSEIEIYLNKNEKQTYLSKKYGTNISKYVYTDKKDKR